MCAPRSNSTSPARDACASTATRLVIVPLGMYSPASLPVRAAASTSSFITVSSPSRESSPCVALCMAASMAGVDRVTVSVRKSMTLFICFSFEQEINQFNKSGAGCGSRHIGGLMREPPGKIADIGNADRVREKPQHRRIVRRVADKYIVRTRGIEINPETAGEQRARRRQLVVVAEPAVDVNG